MARSSYIYVVLQWERNLTAAFTVKHELVTWWRTHKPWPRSYRVYRLRDGQSALANAELDEITAEVCKLAGVDYK